jgi:hypothetical protein
VTDFSPGAVVVGLIFLATGLIKAVSPSVFRGHLFRLGVVPPKMLNFAVALIAAAEAALGVALVTTVAPAFTLAASAALLLILTAVTWFGVTKGKVEDCGCYGGFIAPSLPQTTAINIVLIGLLVFAWSTNPQPILAASVWIPVMLLAGLSFGALAWFGLKHEMREGSPLIDLSPLKPGNTFRAKWAAGNSTRGSDELIVAYLGPDCPFCKLWLPVLNGIHEKETLPRVVGVVGGSVRQIESLRSKGEIRFPMTSIPASLLNRLVRAVPTTVVIKDGRVEDVWSGRLSPQFVGRFTKAFFPDSSADSGEKQAVRPNAL